MSAREKEERARVATTVPDRVGTVDPNRDTAPYAIRLRVWPAEYAAMVEAAKRAGLPVKEWALRVLVGAAK